MKYELDRIGADVEIFLRDKNTGHPVPAIGLIGGTKHEPKPVLELGDGFCVQEDNVMLEYNIPPAKTKEEFVSNVMTMNSYLDELLAKKGLIADICSSMTFSKKQLSHPQAQEMGCEPDWDVWTRTINPSPKENPLIKTTRTSGGHIHISFTVDGKPMEEIFLKEPVVKALDLTIGMLALDFDQDPLRRQLYGKPGAFRNRPGGIEYRCPSNFWTKSPQMIAWAYTGVKQALYLVSNYQQKLQEHYSHLQQAFSYLPKYPDKSAEYRDYLCTNFRLLDRAKGRQAHGSGMPVLKWPQELSA